MQRKTHTQNKRKAKQIQENIFKMDEKKKNAHRKRDRIRRDLKKTRTQ